jgi:hypothetical protein
MSSASEERIRLKAEHALRAAYPEARIIHELVVEQGSCRLDLAAVTPTRLILVEVKSEKDVLDRLEKQVRKAKAVADGVLVVTTHKHIDKARKVAGYRTTCLEDDVSRFLEGYHRRDVLEAATNAPARLGMLWAQELRIVAGMGRKSTRTHCIRFAADNLTGAECRMRVCAALRAREFPRADPPVLSELFSSPTRFQP